MSSAQEGSLQIALVYDCVFPGSAGGVERRNAELARALAARGHRVTLAGWNRGGEESRCGGAVRVLPLGPPARLYGRTGRRRLGAALRFAFHCLRLPVAQYDVVETAQVPFLHLPVLALKCALARRPLVVSWHEFWGRYWKTYEGSILWRGFAVMERFAARVGTLATANSRMTLERLRPHRKTDPPRLLPCGIDLEGMHTILEAARTDRMAKAAPPLIYAGRLLREKRIEVLLKAVALLLDHRGIQRPILRIVGDGPDRARLEELVCQLAIQEAVEFTGRLPSGEEVFAAIAGARVAVQPSSREGFGLFALEAMSAGLPVVYCRSTESAVGEIVREGREGLSVEPRPEDLARALRGLLESPEERNRLAEAALIRAREYSWARIAELAEAMFLELCSCRSSTEMSR